MTLALLLPTLVTAAGCGRAGEVAPLGGSAGPVSRVAQVDGAIDQLGLLVAGDHVVVGWRSRGRPQVASLAWSRDRARSFDSREERLMSGTEGPLPLRWQMTETRPWWQRWWEARPPLAIGPAVQALGPWPARIVDDRTVEVTPPREFADAPSQVRIPRPGLALRWAGPDEQANLATVWADPVRRTLTVYRYVRQGATHTAAASLDQSIAVATGVPADAPVSAAPIRGGLMVAWARPAGANTGINVREVRLEALCAVPSSNARAGFVEVPAGPPPAAPDQAPAAP